MERSASGDCRASHMVQATVFGLPNRAGIDGTFLEVWANG